MTDCNKIQANNLACNKISLTDKWEKGELPDGEYWCLSICDDIDKLNCYQNSFWKYKTEDDYYGLPVEIKQVLAPVPSYEEWQAKLEENTKLKELLKECKQWFDWYHIDTGTGKEYIESWHKKGHEIHQRINQALGEDK